MATKPLVVLCDVDGVICDLVGQLCAELAIRHGRSVRPEDIKHHDFSLSLDAETMRAARDLMKAPGFNYESPWYEGGRSFVADLLSTPHVELLFVTSPYEGNLTWVEGRKEWLAKAGVPKRNVLSVSSAYKKYVHGDVLIEDHVGTLYDWAERHPAGIGVLVDRPWNQKTAKEYRWRENMVRVETLAAALPLHDLPFGVGLADQIHRIVQVA